MMSRPGAGCAVEGHGALFVDDGRAGLIEGPVGEGGEGGGVGVGVLVEELFVDDVAAAISQRL